MKSGCHIYVGQPVLYQRVRRKEEKAMNLKGRNFLKLMDFEPEEILYMIDLAADLKAKKKQGILHDSLIGKNIALILEKTSTRTRCSFEVAAHDLGMHVTYLDPSGSQIGKKESIPERLHILPVLLRYPVHSHDIRFRQTYVPKLLRYPECSLSFQSGSLKRYGKSVLQT